MPRWILGTCIVILLGLIFFEPSYGWDLHQFLDPQPYSGAQNAIGQADGVSLAAENDSLKAQLATLQTIAAQIPLEPQQYIRGMVYSRYPLNFKNEILVNVGAREGVATGSAAVFQGMLIGKVIRVFPDEALVQTVFDSGFTIPVRVGASSYDGLLQGGSYPKVGSIVKTATLAAGDVVYTAAPGLPYGLPIGEVAATSTSADSLFQDATIVFPYDINTIQTILIAQGA